MSNEDKIHQIYTMVLEMKGIIPNLVTRLECSEKHATSNTRVDRIYIFAGFVAGAFALIGSFLGFVIPLYLRAKGII